MSANLAQSRSRDDRQLVVVAAGAMALVALTVWLRYRPLGINSLWLDDAWLADGSRVATVGDTIRTGLSAPGFSVLYRGWSALFGHGATTAQLLALTFAVGAPVVLFLVALERGLPMFAALLGGTLLATASAHMEYSTRLKQYTAEALAATVVLWAAWRVLDRTADGRRWALLTGVAIAASLTSSVGAVTAGTAVAVGFVAALLARPRRIRPAVIAICTYGFVAGLWTLLAVKPNISASESSALANYWRGYFLDGNGFAGDVAGRLEAVARGFQGLDALLVLMILFLAAVLVLLGRPIVGLLLVAPTFVAIVLAALTIFPVGTGRTDIYLFPSYALLVAVAVGEIASRFSGWAWLVGGTTLVAAIGLALNATPVTAQAYPRENLTPLVRIVEQRRQSDDVVVVYPSAGFAYGFATRYPVATSVDAHSPTGWVVKVRGPGIVVLPAHREDPMKWGSELDRITARTKRVWVIGSHYVHRSHELPDWSALFRMLEARRFQIVDIHKRQGAELLLLSRG